MGAENRPRYNQERAPIEVLDEEQTLTFFREQGITRLENPQLHQPFLYVLPQEIRGPDWRHRYESAVARVGNPEEILDYDDQYLVRTIAGVVDYFYIDAASNRPVWIRSSLPAQNTRGKATYYVRKSNMFRADDALFPGKE